MFTFTITSPGEAIAGTESLPSGSFIVNMGITPQTVSNGLKPYGLVYDMIVNYGVPVKWIIESSKVKDGTDFTYNGVNYKGGPFIISSDYINASVTSRISYWQTQGVQGVYTTSVVSAPVYTTLTSFPKILIDTISKNQTIITGYFDNAMIPSSGYSLGSPSLLTSCHDMWVNPHGDPTWATHGALYNFVTVSKSYIWSECHAVSVLESVTDPSSPYEQLNYLSTSGLKCYGSGKCGTIPESHTGNPTSPFTYCYPADAVMQFMGTMDGALNNGSEKWYIPLSTGSWRPTTKRIVTTSDGSTPNEGVLMAYGPGFGDASNGWVMYEAGHDLDASGPGGGTTTEKVAAQRAFFNFVLFAGKAKQLVFTSYTIPSSLESYLTYPVSVSISGGNPGYTYSWTSTLGGTFANSAAASSTFTAPNVVSPTQGVLKCTVTDACGRTNFVSIVITVGPSTLPITLTGFSAEERNGYAEIHWTTASEINNDYFTLYKSSDGNNFMQLAKVNGAGNSTHELSYSYTDKSPFKGNNYYRLAQTDFDGKSKMFDPIELKINEAIEGTVLINVYPVPFTDHLNIEYSLRDNGPVEFLIMNRAGRIVKSKQTEATDQGTNSFTFDDVLSLPTGTYFIVMKHGVEKPTAIKILKI